MYSQRYNSKTVLVNFRVPIGLKDSFDNIVKFKRRNRSQAIVDLMKGYVDSEHTSVEKEIDVHNRMINIFQR